MKICKKEWMKRAADIYKETAALFFPPRCPGCDGLLPLGQGLCDDCRGRVIRIREPVCKKCGKPLADERREYCRECSGRECSDSPCCDKDYGRRGGRSSPCGGRRENCCQGRAVFLYRGIMRQSMYRFKYGNRREYGAFYAAAAAEQYGGWVRSRGIEVIVPVPMYRPKQRKRGYNQAEVFGRALGRELSLPVETGLVKRIRDTTPQKELNDTERRKNLREAFRVTKRSVPYRSILLADDIYTTGSTVNAVAEALLAAGAGEIYYLCICIGQGI